MNVSENTELYRTYGAHPAGEGWSFRVYAPSAREAALAGDFNHWQPVPMERQGSDWVLTVSDARPGDCYKYVITGADGQVRWKADPYGTYAQLYAANGTKIGSDFLVNTYLPNQQYLSEEHQRAKHRQPSGHT